MLLVSICIVAYAHLSACAQTSTAPAEEEWRSLFNGRDLTGWIPKINHHPLGDNYRDTFVVKDGAIRVSYERYEEFGERYGHLMYRTPFSAFRLRLKYRFYGEYMPDVEAWQHSNSGVMFHGQPPETMALDQAFPMSVEFQLLGADGDQPRPTGNVCTPGTHIVIDGELITSHCLESSSPTFPIGEWIDAELEVGPDGHVVHYINGEIVFQYSQPQLDPTEPLAQALIDSAGGQRILTQGHISLQSEGHPIQFRDIEVMELLPN